MIRVLRSLGHEIEVVTALPNHPTGRIFPEYRSRFYTVENFDGVPVHRLWMYAATGAGGRRLFSYFTFMLTCIWGLIKCRRPDYVFVESPPLFLSIPGFIAARFWRAKMVFNVADLWPDSVKELKLMGDGWAMRLAEGLERWSYRVSDKVNAVTDGIRSVLIEQKGVPASKVTFLPNGVDTILFRPGEPDWSIARKIGIEHKKVFLYAGTLGYAQGLETVLESARLLSGHDDILFLFIGDGSEKQRLKRIVEEHGLRNVRFLEPEPPEFVAELFRISVAGLAVLRDLPLFRGARPSKVFPCMASGVPVMYSGAGEGADLVEQAGAGLVSPPEDPRVLADCVLRLARDPELAERLGLSGRRYVEAHLSWSALIETWIDHLVDGGIQS